MENNLAFDYVKRNVSKLLEEYVLRIHLFKSSNSSQRAVYRGRLDELEIVFLSQTEQSADILMQVDRRARGLGSFLSEAFETDESYIRLSITT